MTQPAILTSAVQVSELARRLAAETAIAIDLEADSLHHYRDKVCLMQISTPQETVLIDTLMVDHLDPLRGVLADAGIRKIFHAADYDLRCLRRDFSLEVEGLFDTMISAQLLGEERIGLADLLHKYFGVVLDKRFQRADWSQRPLPRQMIDYAAEDTRHLHRLAELFEQRLLQLGRMGWANEEFALLEQVRFEEHPGPLCLRLKGAGKLERRQLGVLDELLQWREAEGRSQDRPVFKIVGNQVLLEVARQAPLTDETLAAVDGISDRLLQRFGKPMLKAVRRGLDRPEKELPSFPRQERSAKDPEAEAALQALKAWRKRKAASLQIEPGVLINNSVLEELARARPQFSADLEGIQALKVWQRKELGQDLVRVLSRPAD